MAMPETVAGEPGGGPSQELTIKARKLDRSVHGADIVVGKRTARLTARLSGWYDGDDNAQDGIAWAWVRLTPTAAVVHEGDGTEQQICIYDATAAALRSLGIVALGIMVASWLIRKLAHRAHYSGGKR